MVKLMRDGYGGGRMEVALCDYSAGYLLSLIEILTTNLMLFLVFSGRWLVVRRDKSRQLPSNL